jgi:hypothetical protein
MVDLPSKIKAIPGSAKTQLLKTILVSFYFERTGLIVFISR